MGLFDIFTGTKRPTGDIEPRSAAEVRVALLAVNRETAPFVIRDGADQGVDLIAEWRIVDARWYEIFAKAGLSKTFQILMRLDPEAHEVRAVDREWEVRWRAGVPELSVAASGFRGQKVAVEFGTAYAFTEQLDYGQVYNYRFATKELKEPITQVVTGNGWTYRGVAFGKL